MPKFDLEGKIVISPIAAELKPEDDKALLESIWIALSTVELALIRFGIREGDKLAFTDYPYETAELYRIQTSGCLRELLIRIKKQINQSKMRSPKTTNVLAATVLERTHGSDVILLTIDLPNPIYPYDGNAVLQLNAAQAQGAKWCTDNLPGVEVAVIDV